MQAGNGYWEEPDPGGLTVIVVGVVMAVMYSRANAPQYLSSASSKINGTGYFREWQNEGFLEGMELYATPSKKICSILPSLEFLSCQQDLGLLHGTWSGSKRICT